MQNKDGNTVAMLLASNGIIPPICWEHDSIISNKNGNTVAMLLAKSKIIPSNNWIHDPNI